MSEQQLGKPDSLAFVGKPNSFAFPTALSSHYGKMPGRENNSTFENMMQDAGASGYSQSELDSYRATAMVVARMMFGG